MNLTSINRRNNKDKINQDKEPWKGIEGREPRLKVIETGRQGDRWLERESGGQTASKADRQPEREKGCQPVREEQTGRQAGRQT